MQPHIGNPSKASWGDEGNALGNDERGMMGAFGGNRGATMEFHGNSFTSSFENRREGNSGKDGWGLLKGMGTTGSSQKLWESRDDAITVENGETSMESNGNSYRAFEKDGGSRKPRGISGTMLGGSIWEDRKELTGNGMEPAEFCLNGLDGGETSWVRSIVPSGMKQRVFVGGLFKEYVEGLVRKDFERFGAVDHVDLLNKGGVFVQFATSDGFKKSLRFGSNFSLFRKEEKDDKLPAQSESAAKRTTDVGEVVKNDNAPQQASVPLATQHAKVVTTASASSRMTKQKPNAAFEAEASAPKVPVTQNLRVTASAVATPRAPANERDSRTAVSASTSQKILSSQTRDDRSQDVIGKRVFVGGFGADVIDTELQNVMERFGKVEYAVVMTDEVTGRNRGYGFVTYETWADAEAACATKTLHVKGKECSVRFPRRAKEVIKNALDHNGLDKNGEMEERVVYVGGFGETIRDNELKRAMGNLGKIESAVVMMDPLTGKNRGFGYVTFESLADAEAACVTNKTIRLGKKECRVEFPQRQKEIIKNEPHRNIEKQERQVFINGFGNMVGDIDLKCAMGHYGEIEKIDIVTDRETGKSLGSGFITFVNPEDAESACKIPSQFLFGKPCDMRLRN